MTKSLMIEGLFLLARRLGLRRRRRRVRVVCNLARLRGVVRMRFSEFEGRVEVVTRRRLRRGLFWLMRKLGGIVFDISLRLAPLKLND